MTTRFVVEMEEDIDPQVALRLLGDMEEVTARAGLSLFDSEVTVDGEIIEQEWEEPVTCPECGSDNVGQPQLRETWMCFECKYEW